MTKIKDALSPRTLVEFYDSDYLENIISLLRCSYSGVVYAYFTHANEPTAHDRDALSEYIKNNFGFTPHFLEIAENTIDCALSSFRKLVAGSGLYDFDITGGSSVFIAAAGALAVADNGNRIFLHEFAPATGIRVFSYPENTPSSLRGTTSLTVHHVLSLRGIEILHLNHPIRYRLNRDDLRGEIIRLWDTIRSELKAWNSFSCIAANVEHRDDCAIVSKHLNNAQSIHFGELLIKLIKSGIISDLREQKTKDALE